MSASLARTADGWWAVTPAGLVRLGLPATTTAGLLADPAALAAAIEAAHAAGAQDALLVDLVRRPELAGHAGGYLGAAW